MTPDFIGRRQQHGPTSGFTLIEVLVCLVIVAVVLIAALRAVGSMAETNQALHARLLAGWSADNRVSELHLAHAWPVLGDRSYRCDQANLQLLCTESVSATPNPIFRRVDVSVRAVGDDTAVLGEVITLLADETSRSL